MGEESAPEGLDSSHSFYHPSDFPELKHLSAIIINTENDNRPHAVITVLGRSVTGLLDSGANCSLLGGKAIKMVEELQLKKGTVKGGIQTADGTKHGIETFVNLPIAYNGRNENLPTLLVPSLPDCVILGMNFWNKFGVRATCNALTAITPEEDQPDPEPMRLLSKSNITY